MCVCYSSGRHSLNLPVETRLLSDVSVRLISDQERQRHDQLMEEEHYLGNSNAIGQVLRYVAEHNGQWVAALTFCSSSLHLKPRDQRLGWDAAMLRERRHLIAQNSRFLILPSTGHWPNLASKILKLVCQRLHDDWFHHFGIPVLLVETFVDPQRFKGTCYQSAGWQALGKTKGYARRGRDFYDNTQHPKEIWIRPLRKNAYKILRASTLPTHLCSGIAPKPPQATVDTSRLPSLWDFVRDHITDPRSPKGIRYPIASVVCIAVLGIAAGCEGTHAIAEFAQSLNHGQRRRLRCRPQQGSRHKFEVPCERTFIRLLRSIDSDQLKDIFVRWMEQLDPQEPSVIHLDGKILKNTQPAPPTSQNDNEKPEGKIEIDTVEELQKPKSNKALTLVNFQTPQQRMIDQIAVPSDTNEEAAVALHLPTMNLAGKTVIADAAHTVKANCLLLTRRLGADYVFWIKANQPNAHAKVKQLLSGNFPPCI